MVEARASQAGLYGLAGATPEVRAAQAGIYGMAAVSPEVRASQVGLYGLVAITAEVKTSQAGLYLLAAAQPCGTRWAQIWTITRTDGEVFRFTSKDTDLLWGGDIYQSCSSLTPSASENVSEVDAAGNMDLTGAIGPDGITEADLYAGLFDGAQVSAWLVAWQGEEPRKRLLSGTFGNLEQTPSGFKIELQGDGKRLLQTPLVRTLKPGCGYQFGDPLTCRKDLAPLTVTGTVDSGLGQREFTDAARAEAAGYFSRGRVTFTGGANAGVSAEIKEHLAGGVFRLWPRLPFGIVAGDPYSMVPGCTNLKDSSGGTNGCSAWGNYVNYGGEPDVPTKDKLTAAAVVKKAS